LPPPLPLPSRACAAAPLLGAAAPRLALCLWPRAPATAPSRGAASPRASSLPLLSLLSRLMPPPLPLLPACTRATALFSGAAAPRTATALSFLGVAALQPPPLTLFLQPRAPATALSLVPPLLPPLRLLRRTHAIAPVGAAAPRATFSCLRAASLPPPLHLFLLLCTRAVALMGAAAPHTTISCLGAAALPPPPPPCCLLPRARVVDLLDAAALCAASSCFGAAALPPPPPPRLPLGAAMLPATRSCSAPGVAPGSSSATGLSLVQHLFAHRCGDLGDRPALRTVSGDGPVPRTALGDGPVPLLRARAIAPMGAAALRARPPRVGATALVGRSCPRVRFR